MYAAIQDGRFLICDESEVACEAFARGCESVDAYREWLDELPQDRWGRPQIPEAPYRLVRLDGVLRERYERLLAEGYETREILYREAASDSESDGEEQLAMNDEASDAGAESDPVAFAEFAGPGGSDADLPEPAADILIGDDEARAARTEPDQWREIRAQRDQLLLESDKYMIPDFPIEAAEREAWRKYRAALRDITKSARRPERVRWPASP